MKHGLMRIRPVARRSHNLSETEHDSDTVDRESPARSGQALESPENERMKQLPLRKSCSATNCCLDLPDSYSIHKSEFLASPHSWLLGRTLQLLVSSVRGWLHL